MAEAKKALAAGDVSGAVTGYEQAIAAGEDTAETWTALAEAQLRQENYEKSADAAYKAYVAGAAPADQAKALARLGRILEKAENPTQALAAYQQSQALAPDPQLKTHIAALTESLRFRVIGQSVAAAGDQPEICLDFYGNLPATTDVHYEDYVKIAPALSGAAFTVNDAKLCIAGVDYGQHYRVTVLTGLPSAAGDKLAKQENVDFLVGDSEPSLGFKSATYVLPRDGSIGVPLYSVNVTKAKLRLLRINDRNLIQTIQRGLFLRAVDNYDADTIAQDTGEQVWTGTVAVDPQRNQRVTTLVPVSEMVPQMKSGVYLLVAERTDGGEDKYGYKATQWLIVTDYGLTTMTGDDGLHVFLRSLDTGQPVEGVTVKLYARNNGELGSAVSDSSGQAGFAPGLMRATEGRTATAVMAFGKDGDFAFLDLTRPAFDLSDRGVGGRLAPSGADVFLYADRGVYRPGETVHLAALLRDTTGNAMDGLPLIIRLVRPDEVEAHRYTLTAVQGRRLCRGYPDLRLGAHRRLGPAGLSRSQGRSHRQPQLPGRGCRAGEDRDQAHHQGDGHRARPAERSDAAERLSLWRSGRRSAGEGDPHHRAGQRSLRQSLPGLPLRPGGREGRARRSRPGTTPPPMPRVRRAST